MTERQMAVTQLALTPGITQQQIADKVGCSHQAVSKILRKEDVKTIVEGAQVGFLLANVKRACGNITQVIHSTSSKDKELRTKLSVEVAKSIGVLQAPAQSVVINNLFLTGDIATQVPPEVQALLDIRDLQAVSSDVVDAEYQDI